MDTEIVEVRNAGANPVVLRYGGNVYPVNPGQRAAVPVQAVKRTVGDWTKVDNPDQNFMPRTRERDRLATLHGLCGDAFYSDDPIETMSLAIEANEGNPRVKPADYDPIEAVDGRRVFMHPNLPRLEVFDLSSQERILTVLDDPDGDMAVGTAFHAVARAGEDATKAQIEQLQAQVSMLVNQLAQTNPETARDIAIASTPVATVTHAQSPPATSAPANSMDDMDVMNAELGTTEPDAPKPVKKRATKKAATRRGDDD